MVRLWKRISIFLLSALLLASAGVPAVVDAMITPARSVEERQLFLPLVTRLTPDSRLDEVRPMGLSCPEGYRLVDATGAPFNFSSDSEEYSDVDGWCVPNQSLVELSCSDNGDPMLINGRAVCGCDEGYAGADCSVCAAGYEADGFGACTALEQTDITITGGELSLEFGESALLQASSPSGGTFDWELREGDEGCLKLNLADPCAESIVGAAQVYYVAPATGSEMGFALATVKKNAAPGMSASQTLAYAPPGSVKFYGKGDPDLFAFVRIIENFMRFHCIGAGTLGISKHKIPVGQWGFGRTYGRPVESAMVGCPQSGGAYYPGAQQVTPQTPFRLGSVSKSVAYMIARRELHNRYYDLYGVSPAEGAIEAMHLLDADFLGMQLLPDNIYEIFTRQAPLPRVYAPTDPDVEPLDGYADPRWADVTIGQLISHRSGQRRDQQGNLAQGGSQIVSVLYKDTLRNLNSQADFQSQQAILEAQYGAAAVTAVRNQIAALTGQPANSIYLIPQPTMPESLINAAGSALVSDPGADYLYSNIDPVILTLVAEHLSGKPFSVDNGVTAGFQDTLLYEYLGFPINAIPPDAVSNLYRSHFLTPAQAAGLLKEPVTRNWNVDQQTWYPTAWDSKRPFCIWSSGECSFTSWINNGSFRPNWAFEIAQMPVIDSKERIWVGSGLIAADAPTFLKFMSNFWVGGYDVDPRIGEWRYNVNNLYTAHNGAYDGIYALAVQFGSDGSQIFEMPVLKPDGKLPSPSAHGPLDFQVVATSQMVTTYNKDGSPYDGFFEAPESLAIGRRDVTGGGLIYMATSAWGALKIYTPDGVLVAEHNIGFEEFDQISVKDVDGDIFDEIMLSKPGSSGELKLFDHNGSFVSVITNTLQTGDRAVLGDWNGDFRHEPFILRKNGVLQVRTIDGTGGFNSPVELSPGDGFAVGNVTGNARDEVLIARKASGMIDIYTYNGNMNQYVKWQSFQGYFETGSDIAVSDLGTSFNYITIGQPSTGKVRVFQARPTQQWTFDIKVELDNLNNYQAGSLLAIGRINTGTFMYQCSAVDGSVKFSLPDGVDVFVAFNQDSGSRHLESLLRLAACQIDWSKVSP